jgi:hypothetical protein
MRARCILPWIVIVSTIGVLSAISGCAHDIDAARVRLTSAAKAVSSSTKAVDAFDKKKHEEIRSMPDPVAASNAFGVYRAKRDKVVEALVSAVGTISAASSIVSQVELGSRKKTELTFWLSEVGKALKVLGDALTNLGVAVPAEIKAGV